jgi:hypothetical protein
MFLKSCSIHVFLNAPNLDNPLVKNIVKHWKSDEVEDVATSLYFN